MWIILGLMIFGSLIGFLLSGRKHFNPVSEKLTAYIIYLLLFLMGLSVGVNKEIMSNLEDLGIQAFIITLFTITGSVLMAWILQKTFFRQTKNIKNNPDIK